MAVSGRIATAIAAVAAALFAAPTASHAAIKGYGCATERATYGAKGVVMVGSYNIGGATVTAGINNWTWSDRRNGVADFLVDCALDVYNLQEAGASHLPGSGDGNSTSQFEDLRSLVNRKLEAAKVDDRYEYVNAGRSNCYTNERDCDSDSKNASNDNRILYNTATTSLVSQGWGDLPSKKTRRTVAYATLRPKATGTAYFVATTHLDAGSGSNWDRYRTTQMQRALEFVKARNSKKLPTILTGDLNSGRYTKNATAADLPPKSGLKMIEILGHDRKTHTWGRGSCTVPSSYRTSYRVPYVASARINAYYDTSTASDLKNQCAADWRNNGSPIDYIFTSRNIRPKVWETVVHSDGKGGYVPMRGYPSSRPNPSDHNMITARLVLLDSKAW